MDKRFAVENIAEALTTRQFPSITMWNRLEPRPRTNNFDRALRAEVRDALWMLTKQWQMGEFHGDDAGSPIFAKVQVGLTRMRKYKAGDGSAEKFDDSVPLEAKVERRPIPFVVEGKDISLDIRLLMGRQWLKMVSAVGNYAQAFTNQYGIDLPDPTHKEDAHLCAHPEVWQAVSAVAGRRMDGGKLYLHLTSEPAGHASDDIPVLAIHRLSIDDLGTTFVQWFESSFFQPPRTSKDAWIADRLEYQFGCSAPDGGGEKVFVADEYYQGHLDWYNLDIDKAAKTLGKVAGEDNTQPPPDLQSLIPVQVTYDGMPNTRWWTFEDRRVNFAGIKPDTTDLGKLLFIEFGLVYANDWFLIPYSLPAGSVARVQGMAVTNVFGERFWIEAAGSGHDDNWQRWSMFTVNTKWKREEIADTSLLLLPVAAKVQEGKPVEEVMMLRDEVANMVWGVERIVPLATGQGKSGFEVATETTAFYRQFLDQRLHANPGDRPILDYKAKISYQVMNSVPENWIPFVPVHIPGDNREIQVQRAAMPRVLEGDPDDPEKVQPRTVLLREGLDHRPADVYFLHEEEVPRAGVIVVQSYQRTRWRNGTVFVWLGARKQTGRGEGTSGLGFDRIVDVQPAHE
jgi:hypothetical protein